MHKQNTHRSLFSVILGSLMLILASQLSTSCATTSAPLSNEGKGVLIVEKLTAQDALSYVEAGPVSCEMSPILLRGKEAEAPAKWEDAEENCKNLLRNNASKLSAQAVVVNKKWRDQCLDILGSNGNKSPCVKMTGVAYKRR